jgi:hypothetical protein
VSQVDTESGFTLKVDGLQRHDQVVPLLDDEREHWVELTISRRDVPAAAPELVQ